MSISVMSFDIGDEAFVKIPSPLPPAFETYNPEWVGRLTGSNGARVRLVHSYTWRDVHGWYVGPGGVTNWFPTIFLSRIDTRQGCLFL